MSAFENLVAWGMYYMFVCIKLCYCSVHSINAQNSGVLMGTGLTKWVVNS